MDSLGIEEGSIISNVSNFGNKMITSTKEYKEHPSTTYSRSLLLDADSTLRHPSEDSSSTKNSETIDDKSEYRKKDKNNNTRSRDDFFNYWRCAYKAFGASNEGMLLRKTASQDGFASLDCHEVMMALTSSIISTVKKDEQMYKQVDIHKNETIKNMSTINNMNIKITVVNDDEISNPISINDRNSSIKTYLNDSRRKNSIYDASTTTMTSTACNPHGYIDHFDGDTTNFAHFEIGEIDTDDFIQKFDISSPSSSLSTSPTLSSVVTPSPTSSSLSSLLTASPSSSPSLSPTSSTSPMVHRSPFKTQAILEIGAGIGRLTSALQSVSEEICAVDFVEEYIHENKMNHGSTERPSDLFICADATTLSFPLDDEIIIKGSFSPLHPSSSSLSSSSSSSSLSMSLKKKKEKFDIVMWNWLLMYLDDDECKSFLNNAFRWCKKLGFIFLRESCGEPSDKGSKERNWATCGNPTRYRSHEVYTHWVDEAAKEAGVNFEYIVSAHPLSLYKRNIGTDGQRYWILRVLS